jgi:hypothetical protein
MQNKIAISLKGRRSPKAALKLSLVQLSCDCVLVVQTDPRLVLNFQDGFLFVMGCSPHIHLF